MDVACDIHCIFIEADYEDTTAIFFFVNFVHSTSDRAVY